MSCWPFTALPAGTRPDRGSASTMRTIVTTILQKTARQRLGPHLLVSDDPPRVTRRRQIREQAAPEPIHRTGRPGQVKPSPALTCPLQLLVAMLQALTMPPSTCVASIEGNAA